MWTREVENYMFMMLEQKVGTAITYPCDRKDVVDAEGESGDVTPFYVTLWTNLVDASPVEHIILLHRSRPPRFVLGYR